MARVSISYKDNGVDILNQAGRHRLGRVQRFEVSSNLPNTPIMELGSTEQVGRIYDTAEVTASVSSIDVGARTVFQLAGVDWAAAPSGTAVEAQDIQYVCLAQAFKAESTNDVARTLVVPAAKLDSLSLNYSVNGDATEDFSFQGTGRTWLRYDAVLVSGVVSGNQLTMSGARVLRNGNYFLAAYSQNGYVPEDGITGSTATTITFDPTLNLNGTTVYAIIHRDETDQWQDTADMVPDMPTGMRGWGVEIYLTRSGTSDVRVYRAQSCSVSVAFNSQRINELGNENVVGYSETTPDVTGTLEVLKHDFRLLERMSGDDAGTADNWDTAIMTGGNWGMEIRLWRRGANRLTTEPEKVVYIPEIEITQDSDSSQTGADATQTFNWSSKTAEVYFYKGFRD